MSLAPAASKGKYKVCSTCRQIYLATKNRCGQDQTPLDPCDDVFGGKFILRRSLGRGGFGEVFEAEDPQNGRTVALKLLSNQADVHKSFNREVKAAGSLSPNDHIVTIYESGRADDNYFIAMEYLEGETLHDYVKKRGTLSVVRAMGLWLQAVRGGAAAHAKGIIHREM